MFLLRAPPRMYRPNGQLMVTGTKRNQQQTRITHTATRDLSSHLIHLPQCSAAGPPWQSASQASESRRSLISQWRRRRKRRSFKGLRSFPLPPGFGRRNKTSPFGQACFISNAAAAFLKRACGHRRQTSGLGFSQFMLVFFFPLCIYANPDSLLYFIQRMWKCSDRYIDGA